MCIRDRYTHNLKKSKYTELTRGKIFYNELSDYPNYPSSYGIAGWSKNDKTIFIYDRYDIWEFDPDTGDSKRLTNGRESKTSYRLIRLDNEIKFIDTSQKLLMITFNELTKNSGYYEFDHKKNIGRQLIDGPYRYSSPKKARLSEEVIYTRQSFIDYPDIRLSNLNFKSDKIISNANPQQVDYNWGTSELVNWSSLDLSLIHI